MLLHLFSYSLTEEETNIETPQMNTETNITENEHGANKTQN